MKNLIRILLLLFVSVQAFGWGQTGHRAMGLLAEKHLSKKARKELNWKPKVSFKELVKGMVEADVKLLKKNSK